MLKLIQCNMEKIELTADEIKVIKQQLNGEIEDENLLAALEQLSDSDLELITLYAYEEYDTVEISKLFGTTKQNISKKIRRITNFIKNFQIRVV